MGARIQPSGNDWIAKARHWHVAAHLAFFAALAVHLSSNLRPRVLARML